MAGTRKEQAAATRQRILDASQKLMGERGFSNVTIADIAQEAGVAAGTLYHYFNGKDAVLSYIERGKFQEAKAEVDAQEFPTVAEKIRAFVLAWCACVERDNLYLSKDWHKLAVDLKVPSEDGRTHLDVDLENFTEFLNEGIAAGEFPADMDVYAVAHDLTFSLYGASFYRCSSYEGFDLNAWAERFVDGALGLHLGK